MKYAILSDIHANLEALETVLARCRELAVDSYLSLGEFDLLAVQGTLKSSPAPQFESTYSSVPNLLYGPALTPVTTGKTIALTTGLCWQSGVFAF